MRPGDPANHIQYSTACPQRNPLLKTHLLLKIPPCWKLAKPCKVLVIMSSISLAIIKWSGFIRCGPLPFRQSPLPTPIPLTPMEQSVQPLVSSC